MPETTNLDQYNADELEAPEWLNAKFIERVLSEYEKRPELKVTNLTVTPGSAQGDHYASAMFRATTDYTTSRGNFSKSLIVKTMPEQEGHKKDLLGDLDIFSTEIGMYTKALPEFERILREAGDKTRLYVPCVYHSLKPHQVMIFEDLVPQGYAVIRDRPVTEDELKAVFTKLAKWHAASMKVLNEKPDFLKEFQNGMCSMSTFMTNPMVTDGLGNFLEFLETVPDLTRYKAYFEKQKHTYIARFEEVLEEYRRNPQSDGYYILCHGDFHLRNMMFRGDKETGTLEDVMFVDFQLSNLCPSSVDLIYSVYMLLESEQRWDLGKGLIDHYCSVLVDTLEKIGYKARMPTQSGIWQQIHRHKHFHFFLLVTFLPFMLAVKSNAIKMADGVENAESRRKCYYLDGYRRDVAKLLPLYEKLGYFKDL
ncbi:hypothetical protein KR018_012357 [Drosophila ironensis]|nr:hypothetical protein KR018_012357 [Drosophila ironensis]